MKSVQDGRGVREQDGKRAAFTFPSEVRLREFLVVKDSHGDEDE